MIRVRTSFIAVLAVVSCFISFTSCAHSKSGKTISGSSYTAPQVPGFRELAMGRVSQSGVFDPSLVDNDPSQIGWMSYSTVDPSGRWPKNDRAISTRLAYSRDRGATWSDLGVVVNAFRDIDNGGTWQSETSALVYDATAPANEKWKLFWHKYLQIKGDRKFEHGWIAYKAAATPQQLRDAQEVKLIATKAYKSVNDDPNGETKSGVAGAPVFKLSSLSPELDKCLVLSEPAPLVTGKGLYLALTCSEISLPFFNVHAKIVMLKCGMPCDPTNASSWSYVSTVLKEDYARDLGYNRFSAADLFIQNGSVYMLVTPSSDKPYKDSYNGCMLLRYVDLDKGLLEQEGNHPRIFKTITGMPNSFNGACSYRPGLTGAGVMLSQLNAGDWPPTFHIVTSGTGL